MKETFCEVKGFPKYRVSTKGKVQSKRKNNSWVNLSIQTADSGHKYVNLYRGTGKGYMHQVHALVLNAFVGPCPKGMQCRHLNGKPWDNRLCNLKWGTPRENGEDRVTHDVVNRKMTKKSVLLARKLRKRFGTPFARLVVLLKVPVSWQGMRKAVYANTWKYT